MLQVYAQTIHFYSCKSQFCTVQSHTTFNGDQHLFFLEKIHNFVRVLSYDISKQATYLSCKAESILSDQ
jgi:hypothetical protein